MGDSLLYPKSCRRGRSQTVLTIHLLFAKEPDVLDDFLVFSALVFANRTLDSQDVNEKLNSTLKHISDKRTAVHNGKGKEYGSRMTLVGAL